LFEKTRQFVKDHMSQPRFDASHDYNHILRVVALSMEILRVEQNTFRKIMFDPIIVELVALMHDIDDHKYRPPINQTDGYPSPPSNLDPHSQQIPYDIGPSNPAHDQQTQTIPNLDPSLQTPAPSVVEAHLLELGWPTVYASKAAAITPYVSYTAEATNAPGYASALANYPELAVVQDADRLDAIGATGIGRAFTYGGAKGKEGGMPETMEHFEEKLIKLEAMMKTGEGQRLSVARAERLRIFGRWWHEEMRMVGMAGEGGFEWTQGTSPWASVGVPKGDPVEPGPASKEADIRPPNPDNQAVSGVQPPDGGAAPQVAAQNGDADNMEDVSQANGGQGEAGQQDPGAQLMEAIERSM